MKKIKNKRILIVLGGLVVFSLFSISLLFAGIYLGKHDKLKLFKFFEDSGGFEGVGTVENQKERVEKYDLSSCNESTANIMEELSDSVVTVSIKKLDVKLGSNGAFDPFGFFNFSPRFSPRTEPEYEEVQKDIGTGFVVGEDKFVITNKHVVSDIEAEYRIIDKDENEYEVTKIYRDPSNDMAILQVKDLRLDSIDLGDSDNLRVGEDVIAIGTALGEFRHTVTTGVISGLGRGIVASNGFGREVESLENIIQTDAAINPGNSGGPLINRCGEVIGVNVAVSRNAENIGFAIPINVIKKSIDNFNDTGKFERAFLGVRYNMISDQAALRNEVPVGAYVVEVVEGSSAEKGGIKKGDIIVSFDGKKLNKENLADLVSKTKVGEKIKVEVYRWEEEKSMDLTIKMQEGS